MAENSHIIDRNDDLLSAFIDSQYTLPEIFAYWQEIAGSFPYLGAVPLEEGDLTWDDQHLIAVTKDAGSIVVPGPEVKLSGDAEILEGYFGLPQYQPGIAGANQWILAFMTPERKPAFPIRLSLTRNIVYEKPYSIFGLDITPGTWGSRHLQYKAIEKVFRALQLVEDFGPKDSQTIEEAGTLAHRLQAWETGAVDFGRIRQQLWLAAHQLIQKFSKGKSAILRPVGASGTPHDLSVSRPGEDSRDIPMYTADGFEHAIWIDQLDWWEDTPARKRSIAYWTTKKTTEEWERFYNACMKAVKGTWPSLVEVLQQPPVSPEDMERLITFLQDINWPGAFEAYEFLTSHGKEALEFIDDAIERATATNDEAWLGYLQQARSILAEEEGAGETGAPNTE